MSNDRFLLWLDLETTGSNPTDKIIEVATVITDNDLNYLAEYESVVDIPGEEKMVCLGYIARANAVFNMHKNNGLLKDLILGKGSHIGYIEESIFNMIDRNCGGSPVFLAGSGVGHFDRQFIDREMPELSARLNYAPLDIGNIRRAARWWGYNMPDFNKSKTHRAIDDIKCHIEEARWMKERLFSGN